MKRHTKKTIKRAMRILPSLGWFLIGAALGLFLFVSFVFILFQKFNFEKVYPGIRIDGIDLGGKRIEEVNFLFDEKNQEIGNTLFTFTSDFAIATTSAKELKYGYNADLLSKQAISLGRSNDIFSNISLALQAYLNGLDLTPSYRYSEDALLNFLSPIIQEAYIEPVDAEFAFQNGKVTAFRTSKDGQAVDLEKLKERLNAEFPRVLYTRGGLRSISIEIPIKILEPNITTEKVNSLGIKELLAQGSSLFAHSIPGRIYNIALAASRLNGILIAPNEEFSFAKALGDISAFTGYQQAYIIQNGKTVLGDGGGVCQVSTTFFRALLSAGLPITERHAHAYRVGYYEQDSPPGLDATVYVPTVDLKFKNDTGHHILIQTYTNQSTQQITFALYGTSDERQVILDRPVITQRIPSPQAQYQDDPTLPRGTIKQIDYAAEGARVSFTRHVTKDGKTTTDTFVSVYRPWRAVYLRGTRD